MQIPIHLKRGCIQTAGKRKYEQLVARYLSGKCEDAEKTIVEAQIEILAEFLKYADFPWLRSTYPELNGITETVVYLNRESPGQTISLGFSDEKVNVITKKGVER